MKNADLDAADVKSYQAVGHLSALWAARCAAACRMHDDVLSVAVPFTNNRSCCCSCVTSATTVITTTRKNDAATS